MRAEAVGNGVRLSMSWDDPETYLPALNELIEAQEDLDARRGELGSAALGSLLGRVAVAEDDLDHLFSETISIENAKRLHASLFKAIVGASVNAGTFDHEADW